MRFIKILLFCLLWPAVAATGAPTSGQAEADTLPADKKTLCAAAFDCLQREQFEQAYHYGQQLLALGERTGDRRYCQLYGHLILGTAGIETVPGTETYTHLEMARALAERFHDHEALMRVLNGFGHYAMFVNADVYSGLSYYFQALDEAKRVDNRLQYALLLSNIAGAYLMREDPSGLEYAEEAIRIAQELKEPQPLFYGTMNAAMYHLMNKDHARAGLAIEAIEQLHASKGFGTKSDIFLLKALYHEQLGETTAAYHNYAKAMENFPTASPSTITMVYVEYAALLRADNHAESAIRVLEYGLRHIDESGIPIHKARLLKELALSYRQAGQPGKAMDRALEYMDYQNRLFDEVRERATQETRIKHDIYSREQRISQQQVVILDNRYKIAVLTGTLAVVVLALGLTYFFYRKKTRLYQAIVSQNHEYMQHEKMLLAQIEQLRQAGHPSPVPTDKLQELMNRFTAEMLENKLFTDPSLTIAAVADRLNTNRTYLSKAINDITGKTFTQLINEYRIRQAIAEISDQQADKPLKQISTDVGFNSLSTFYTTFQATTGMTPARYRSQLKGR